VRKISRRIYDRMDHSIYDTESDQWWLPDSAFSQMRAVFNPARVGYARKKLIDELKIDPAAAAALEVGCGGGFLTEEIARMGFASTGSDPSVCSLLAAANHARQNGLKVRYLGGKGESLPFKDSVFEVVFCCDVLEHVLDLPKVISEISRVLKPGGVFCYDTLNRTWLSYLTAIKIGQDWRRWAFMPTDIHVWKMFVKPGEMKSLLRRNGLEWREHRGLKPDIPIPRVLRYLRRRAAGEWSWSDLGSRIRLTESRIKAVMYMGYALKANPSRGASGLPGRKGNHG
jgi:2-polyprenyl-6-hydroxyphenyl methylase/3-demethylubiquinone-9 3-methyltransferase